MRSPLTVEFSNTGRQHRNPFDPLRVLFLSWIFSGTSSSARRRWSPGRWLQGSVRPESSMKSKQQPWNNRQAKELPHPQPSLCGGSSIKAPASCHSAQLSGGQHRFRFLLLLSLLLALSVSFQPEASSSSTVFTFQRSGTRERNSGCQWHFLKLLLKTLFLC